MRLCIPVRDPMALPTSSTVIVCGGGAETGTEVRESPQPAAGELLLALRVVGFCGTDLFKLDTGSAAPGTVLGHELVGEVIAAGDGVEDFTAGDRIAVPHHVPCGTCALCQRGNETMCTTFRENLLIPGGFAEHIVVRPRAVQHCAFKLPGELSDEAAVFIEPAACVLRGIDRATLADGESAAILGGGSMGLLPLLLLKAYRPASPVLLVDPLPERRTLALELGADAAAAPGDEARVAAASLTDELGIDAVFDTVGGAATLDAALTLSREGGAVVLFAHAGDGERANFDLNQLFKFERRILGTYSGSTAEQQKVFKLLTSGRFDPRALISHRLPLDRFAEGVSLARNRQALKVLFTPVENNP